jgi:GAF domain-containing protein
MLASTSSVEDGIVSVSPAAGDLAISSANVQCQTLTRLARAHFGVTTALVTVADANGRRLQALDGLSLDVLPPDLSAPPLHTSTTTTRVVVVPDTSDDGRFGGGRSRNVARGPRFYASCGLTGADGRHLGALYLLDKLPRNLDDTQQNFLRELAALIAHELEREPALSTLRHRVEEL